MVPPSIRLAPHVEQNGAAIVTETVPHFEHFIQLPLCRLNVAVMSGAVNRGDGVGPGFWIRPIGAIP
jgi:hypothetical protein